MLASAPGVNLFIEYLTPERQQCKWRGEWWEYRVLLCDLANWKNFFTAETQRRGVLEEKEKGKTKEERAEEAEGMGVSRDVLSALDTIKPAMPYCIETGIMEPDLNQERRQAHALPDMPPAGKLNAVRSLLEVMVGHWRAR